MKTIENIEKLRSMMKEIEEIFLKHAKEVMLPTLLKNENENVVAVVSSKECNEKVIEVLKKNDCYNEKLSITAEMTIYKRNPIISITYDGIEIEPDIYYITPDNAYYLTKGNDMGLIINEVIQQDKYNPDMKPLQDEIGLKKEKEKHEKLYYNDIIWDKVHIIVNRDSEEIITCRKKLLEFENKNLFEIIKEKDNLPEIKAVNENDIKEEHEFVVVDILPDKIDNKLENFILSIISTFSKDCKGVYLIVYADNVDKLKDIKLISKNVSVFNMTTGNNLVLK